MLQFWNTCINVDEDTDIDLPLLTQLDEESITVSEEQFQKFVSCDVEEFLEEYNLTTVEFCVFPAVDDCHYAFIYDIEKDVHYLFY